MKVFCPKFVFCFSGERLNWFQVRCIQQGLFQQHKLPRTRAMGTGCIAQPKPHRNAPRPGQGGNSPWEKVGFGRRETQCTLQKQRRKPFARGGAAGTPFSCHANLLQSRASPGTGLCDTAHSWLVTFHENEICRTSSIANALQVPRCTAFFFLSSMKPPQDNQEHP